MLSLIWLQHSYLARLEWFFCWGIQNCFKILLPPDRNGQKNKKYFVLEVFHLRFSGQESAFHIWENVNKNKTESYSLFYLMNIFSHVYKYQSSLNRPWASSETLIYYIEIHVTISLKMTVQLYGSIQI